jgi:hypothetical protein
METIAKRQHEFRGLIRLDSKMFLLFLLFYQCERFG